MDSQLVLSTSVYSGALPEIDPMCVELLVILGDKIEVQAKPPIGLKLVQYLEDCKKVVPLVKETDIFRIAKNIKFSFGYPICEQDLIKSASIYQIFDCVEFSDIGTILSRPPWDPLNINPLFALAYGSYPLWSKQIPTLRPISAVTFFTSLVFKKDLPSCNLIHRFDGYFNYPPNEKKDSDGDIVEIFAGSKDFINFGLFKVDERFWKMFWKAALAKNPIIDKPLNWNLSVSFSSSPVDHLVLKLRYQLKSDGNIRSHDDYVNIPWVFEEDVPFIWSAIIYLFFSVRADFMPGSHLIENGPNYFG